MLLKPSKFAIFLTIFGLAVSTIVLADDVDDLIRLLHSDQDEVRYNAARKLRRLGDRALPAIDSLIALLSDTGVPQMFKVQYFGPRVQDAASAALVKIGTPSVSRLVDSLGSPDSETRQWAALTLGQLGPRARSSFTALLQCLKQTQGAEISDDAGELRNFMFQQCLISAVGKIGAEPERVVPILASLSKSSADPLNRAQALKSLYDADPDGTSAIPILMEELASDDGEVLSAAVQTLGKYGPRAYPAVKKLIGLVSTQKIRSDVHFDVGLTAPVRRDVVQALGEIGPGASAAIPVLVSTMHDDDDQTTRLWAAAAIVQISEENAISKAALQMLKDAKAYDALGAAGNEAALSYLIEVLRADASSVPESTHEEVIQAIGEFGPGAASAVPDLLKILDNTTGESYEAYACKYDAIVTLGMIGPSASSALTSLRRIMDKPSDDFLEWQLSDRAEEAIDKIQVTAGTSSVMQKGDQVP
jgi:HEAT repeat protein